MGLLKKDQKLYLKIIPDSNYSKVEFVPEEDLHYSVGTVRDGRGKIYEVTEMKEVDLIFEVKHKQNG